jgi:hypothetical protein
MKSFVAMAFCVLMVLSAASQAQGIFVTQGENGPVFSDKPQPGAKDMTLRPLTVVAPAKEHKAAAPAAPAAAPAPSEVANPEAAVSSYHSFSIVSPANNGSVVANTAVFEVRVAVDPPLSLGEGHYFAVSLNGQPVGQRFTSTDFMIPPEFWGDALPPPNQTIQLDASIVDGNGQVLKKAVPIRFVLRYATVMNHPKRPLPTPNVLPKPVPRPKPELEPAATTTKRLDK